MQIYVFKHFGRWKMVHLNWKKATNSREKIVNRLTSENRVQPFKAAKGDLLKFIESLPAMESHYCRASSNKKYLLPEWSSKSKLYEFYVHDWCRLQNLNPLSITAFNTGLDESNIALFRPKKDQCEKCHYHNLGRLS